MRTISADTYAMSNPALTSLLLWQFAKSYREAGGAAPALPLSFIVLPIAMSGPAIRSFAGTNRTTGFLTWLSRRPELMIELAGNIADARDLTSEALSFGIAYRLFTINSDGALAADSNAVKLRKTGLRPDERVDMLRVAQRLGSWTSQLPDATVFFSLGIAP